MQAKSYRLGAWLGVVGAVSLLGCSAEGGESVEDTLGAQSQAIHGGTIITVGEEADWGLAKLPGKTCSAVAINSNFALTVASCGNLSGGTLRFQTRNYLIDAAFIPNNYMPPPPGPPVIAKYNIQLLRVADPLLDYWGNIWDEPFNTNINTTGPGLVNKTLHCLGSSGAASYGTFVGGSMLGTGLLQLTSTGKYLATGDRGGPCFTVNSGSPPLLVAMNISGFSTKPTNGQANGGTVNPFNAELFNWISTKMQQNPPPL